MVDRSVLLGDAVLRGPAGGEYFSIWGGPLSHKVTTGPTRDGACLVFALFEGARRLIL